MDDIKTQPRTQPHQDPIHQGQRRPSDGLAAAQFDIEQLRGRVAQLAMNTGEGHGILQERIAAVERQAGAVSDRVEALAQRLDAVESQARTLYAVLKANKIIPE
jgi:hypothetical protein